MKKFAKTFRDDVELNFIPDNRHEFLLSTEELALGYGVTFEDIQSYQDNFIEGKHWITQDLIYWTKKGVIELGCTLKSQRAVKFNKWCIKLTLNLHSSNTDNNILKYYELYGSLNPNAEFTIEHHDVEVKVYYDESLGFLISTPELSNILNIGSAAIRASKVYHKDKLENNIHFIKLGKNNWWTKEGAQFIALRCKDESFGRYLSSDAFNETLLAVSK